MIDSISRRQMLKTAALAGLAQGLPNPARAAAPQQDRREPLLRYAAGVAPSLFRDPSGILKYPSLSPSQPGKAYSTQLWDWDTLWTTFSIASRPAAGSPS